MKLAEALKAKDEASVPVPTDLAVAVFLEGMHDEAVKHYVKRRPYESYRYSSTGI